MFNFYENKILFSDDQKMRLLICLVMLVGHVTCDAFDEEQYGVKYANDCEVCKIVTEEFVTLRTRTREAGIAKAAE